MKISMFVHKLYCILTSLKICLFSILCMLKRDLYIKKIMPPLLLLFLIFYLIA